ncbi:peptidoglycan DD-metalloendopeptidase family protein [Flammeovirga agarivorans]|uniref:Peptidoglycan DD-metalloendopeptidase family protein n=1 Tax=Flammeovirga agarivorans TaxID=2726742 RepID=A0A7X8SGL7_9BACT|nr:peptidoglycan DD-metalloendopeptidase family protein [Flammeovirga agarivorans]NLR89880.1 peptidoglycan DD-metalloendopeptidase family protein [Flammeovirga agarivorans]
MKNVIKSFIAGLITFGAMSCETSNNNTEVNDQLTTDSIYVEVDTSEYLYNINIDTLVVKEGKIRRNQNLSDVLTKYDIDYSTIYKLANNSKGVFDVRRIKYGQKYTLLFGADSNRVDYFIYEEDDINYVVFNVKDSCTVYKGEKPVTLQKKEVHGDITSSLYQTLTDQNESPLLVNLLSDVFAWQIDFFHIQKGDGFKVIFFEKVVEDSVVGIDHIEAAMFRHLGKDYYAFDYEYNGKQEYFDEFGNSLRKEFLKAPLHFSRISSSFSRRRYHPVQKRYKAHLGTDYAAPIGTPIHAVGDGEIIAATYSKYNGNYVKIRHNSVYTTQYLHMNKIKKGIRRGVRVTQGDVIGYVGKTGLASGPHLCYRFWKNGKQVDSRKQELPSSEPLPDSLITSYQEQIMPLKLELDKVDLIMSK